MSALLTDNLPLLAGAPNGIQKLRELILELAVRGKLVPQDPSDEPASELLKRIAAEKARLVAEGKIRKQKPLAEIGEEDKPFELPEGWEWVRLGEIAEVIRGVTYGKSDSSETLLLDYAPLLRANNINRVLNFEKLVFVPKNLIAEQQYVRCGDVVIAMSSGSADLVGKAAQAEADYEGAFGAFCGVVRARNFELFPFFGFFFQTPLYRRRAAGHGKGIGINNLQKSVLETLEIPLPPLAEQHRIVSKVDELMALCDRLEARQADAESAHARLVQALLDSLTQASDADDFAASWQRLAEHFHSLFTSESSIDALRQTLLQLGVIGRLTNAKLIANFQIQDVAQLIDGDRGAKYPKAHEYLEDGYCLFLSAKNVRQGYFEFFEKQFITRQKHEELRNGMLERGDVVITTRGTLGNVAWYSDSIPYNVVRVNSGMLIVRADCEKISPEFLVRFMQSPLFNQQLREMRTGSAQPQIPAGILKKFSLPLFSLAEQKSIVAKLDQLMALCDQLKSRLSTARQLHERLAGALVEQAVA